jgi:ATP-dependent exoDNAse (exonuclease V) beta subunit
MLLADSPSRSFGVAVPPGEGAKLGEAVHEVLKSIDMASKEGLDQLAHLYASKVGIKGKEDEIKRLVLSILNSEEIKKVVQLRYWREVPVGVTISGFILEGIIDLIYEKPDGGMVIVDYKTDFVDKEEIEQRMVDYELQGGFYALALEEILGKKVSRILFIFANPNETRTLLNIDLIKQKVLEAIVV